MKHLLILITCILLVSCKDEGVTKRNHHTLPYTIVTVSYQSSGLNEYTYKDSEGDITVFYDKTGMYKIGDIIGETTLPIDLPEEYPLISENPNKPDTLIAFIVKGKLTFRFLTAAKNYPEYNH